MLNSLKGIKEINGKKVMTNEDRPLTECGSVDWEKFDKMRNEFPICVDHEKDMISFKVMTEPASEGGDLRNAQWYDLVATGLEMLKYFNTKENGKYSCRENAITITKIEEALMWQEKRTKDRLARGVEGKNEK